MRRRTSMRCTRKTKCWSTFVLSNVMEGQMPRRALALVLEWAQEHRVELMEDWELCSHNQSPKKIRPLP